MISGHSAKNPATPGGAQINLVFLGAISVVAALGGLLFGYDWVVIGGAAKFYEPFFHLTDTAATVAVDSTWWEKIRGNAISPVGWAQSCALLGCLVGAVASGPLSDRFGRKPVLIAAAVNFVVSSMAIAFAGSFGGFVAWRILGGVSIGVASNISLLYISEIAPSRHRGLLVAVNQLTIVLGVLAAQLINWRIAEPVPAGLTPAAFLATWNVQMGWRWMFAACAVPSVLFFLSSLFVPESPRWLAKVGRHAQARSVLTRIGGPDYAASALVEIDASVAPENSRVRIGVWQFNTLLGPAGTFWVYAGICVLGFVFILLRLPETKGKSLEQIERELANS
jgi:MFS family permease